MLYVFEELSEASRRQILAELRKGARCVSELVESTGLKQPNVSNHLARMKCRGIVHASKVGRQVYYSLASAEVEDIVKSVFREAGDCCCEFDLAELAKHYAKAAATGDETCCAAMIEKAVNAGIGILGVYEQVLGPAMAAIGRWYQDGLIGEANEHMASEVTLRMLARVFSCCPMGAPGARCAVLGLPSGSYHLIGLRMANDWLRTGGWTTRFLGANVPMESFLEVVSRNNPALVLTSLSAEANFTDTMYLVEGLHQFRQHGLSYQIVVGGSAAKTHESEFRKQGADCIVTTISELTDQVLAPC